MQTADQEALSEVYWAYSAAGQKGLDGRSFVRLCRAAALVADDFKDADAERIFTETMLVAKRRLDFQRLQEALRRIAARKGLAEQDIIELVVRSHAETQAGERKHKHRRHSRSSSRTKHGRKAPSSSVFPLAEEVAGREEEAAEKEAAAPPSPQGGAAGAVGICGTREVEPLDRESLMVEVPAVPEKGCGAAGSDVASTTFPSPRSLPETPSVSQSSGWTLCLSSSSGWGEASTSSRQGMAEAPPSPPTTTCAGPRRSASVPSSLAAGRYAGGFCGVGELDDPGRAQLMLTPERPAEPPSPTPLSPSAPSKPQDIALTRRSLLPSSSSPSLAAPLHSGPKRARGAAAGLEERQPQRLLPSSSPSLAMPRHLSPARAPAAEEGCPRSLLAASGLASKKTPSGTTPVDSLVAASSAYSRRAVPAAGGAGGALDDPGRAAAAAGRRSASAPGLRGEDRSKAAGAAYLGGFGEVDDPGRAEASKVRSTGSSVPKLQLPSADCRREALTAYVAGFGTARGVDDPGRAQGLRPRRKSRDGSASQRESPRPPQDRRVEMPAAAADAGTGAGPKCDSARGQPLKKLEATIAVLQEALANKSDANKEASAGLGSVHDDDDRARPLRSVGRRRPSEASAGPPTLLGAAVGPTKDKRRAAAAAYVGGFRGEGLDDPGRRPAPKRAASEGALAAKDHRQAALARYASGFATGFDDPGRAPPPPPPPPLPALPAVLPSARQDTPRCREASREVTRSVMRRSFRAASEHAEELRRAEAEASASEGEKAEAALPDFLAAEIVGAIEAPAPSLRPAPAAPVKLKLDFEKLKPEPPTTTIRPTGTLLGTYSVFAQGPERMDCKAFARLCKRCCLLEEKFSAAAAREVFWLVAPSAGGGSGYMTFEAFEAALVKIAAMRGLDVALVRRMVSWYQPAEEPTVVHNEESAARAHAPAPGADAGLVLATSRTSRDKAPQLRERCGSVPCVGRLRPSMLRASSAGAVAAPAGALQRGAAPAAAERATQEVRNRLLCQPLSRLPGPPQGSPMVCAF